MKSNKSLGWEVHSAFMQVIQLNRPSLSTLAAIDCYRIESHWNESISSQPSVRWCWSVVAPLVCFEQATRQTWARHLPACVAAGPLCRLLAASGWSWTVVLAWLVEQAPDAPAPPRDSVLYSVADTTLKGKRAQKNPGAEAWRCNQYEPYTFRLHALVLLAQWDVYRIPLAFRLVQRKGSNGYQSENTLLRQMLGEVCLPAWFITVIVVADAAYAPRQNLQAIQASHWSFVLALPRTWKFADGHSLRELVAHLPRACYRNVRLHLVDSRAQYRVFWTFAKPTRCVRREMSPWC